MLSAPDKSTQSQSKLALMQGNKNKTILNILFQYKSTVCSLSLKWSFRVYNVRKSEPHLRTILNQNIQE